MLDILVTTDKTTTGLVRCLNTIPVRDDLVVHVVPFQGTTASERRGATYNAVLTSCVQPMFTIINANDYYVEEAFSLLNTIIRNQFFGFMHCASRNALTNKITHKFKLADGLAFNYLDDPVFFNRKIVDYLLMFDPNLRDPIYDMILKIWEQFEVRHSDIPLTYSVHKTFAPNDLDLIECAASIRGSKKFYHTGPNDCLYPANLLDPLFT